MAGNLRDTLGMSSTLQQSSQVAAVQQGRRSVAVTFGELTDGVTSVLSTSHSKALFTLSGWEVSWDKLGNFLAVITPDADTVCVHDGLSGACLASWDMQPVPRADSLVVGLRWLPTGTALMGKLHRRCHPASWYKSGPDCSSSDEKHCPLLEEQVFFLRLIFAQPPDS